MQLHASIITAALILIASSPADALPQDVHVWQKQELTFKSEHSFNNAYTDVRVWVDLKGPEFDKRVYGFWDGENTFRVRVLATAPGRWTWTSGSDPQTAGLSGKKGSFVAREWTERSEERRVGKEGRTR